MSTYNRVVAADETASLAPEVRARLATEMADPTSDVGASLSDTFGATDVDLSGGSVELNSTPRMVRLIGATTVSNVTLPDGYIDCLIDNGTDYSINVKRLGASGAVLLPSGSTVEIVGS